MEITVIFLCIIVVAQVVERYFYAKEMNKQLGNAVKAIMSRNINEFMAATLVDKASEEVKINTDEELVSDLSDKDFNDLIKRETK